MQRGYNKLGLNASGSKKSDLIVAQFVSFLSIFLFCGVTFVFI
jgi:hypothetical protein